MIDENEVFAVVWIGEEFDKPSMPMHDVGFYSNYKKARARVAAWFADHGRKGWTVCERGMVYHNRENNSYISIVSDTVG